MDVLEQMAAEDTLAPRTYPIPVFVRRTTSCALWWWTVRGASTERVLLWDPVAICGCN